MLFFVKGGFFMFDLLFSVWGSLSNVTFFCYVPAAALLCGIVSLIRSFFGEVKI